MGEGSVPVLTRWKKHSQRTSRTELVSTSAVCDPREGASKFLAGRVTYRLLRLHPLPGLPFLISDELLLLDTSIIALRPPVKHE